jgi:galactokinase
MAETGLTLRGWEGVVASDVPVGAGLSSSASLELAVARAFAAAADLAWDAPGMARLCQRAENVWAGVNCGIMDQLASACGRAGHALLMDCRSLEISYAPLDARVRVVILDTAKRRGLADSAYNERRAECAAAARGCGAVSLRDVAMVDLEKHRDELGAVTFQRARHVVSENARTLNAHELLRRGELAAVGGLMNESHASLRDDFAVSCNELDAMVECARELRGCLGARMTGAGFGGCAVALVETAAVDTFTASVADAYVARTGLTPAIHVCRAVDGAEILESA